MKIFLGTDICEIERINKVYLKYGKNFLLKTFTENEASYCLENSKNTIASLAVRFATKEAVSKALGVGLNGLGWGDGIDWKDIELLRSKNGAVELHIYNKAKSFADKMGIENWTVSVSHSSNNAISTVIGYGE